MRNSSISICKGLAIIMMVIGHAEGPSGLLSVIFLFHMPLFFITSGYFFSGRYAQNPWEFCKRKVEGLYVPFVKWSVLFLLLHNFFFKWGIMNEQYGNWEGGVTHPYTSYVMGQRLVNIIFSMGGYDEFLCGAFWFFRALLIVCILFIVLRVALERFGYVRRCPIMAEVTIALLAVLTAMYMAYNQYRIFTIVQGGMREMCGLFFFSIGVCYRHFEQRLRKHWVTALLGFVMLLWCAHNHCAGMNFRMSLNNVATLSLTGCIGFYVTHCISTWIESFKEKNIIRRFLIYCGDNTMGIFVFHIISFKLASLLKIWYYDLDWLQIGGHMVVHSHQPDYFWIVYTIIGVAVPLTWTYCYGKLTK